MEPVYALLIAAAIAAALTYPIVMLIRWIFDYPGESRGGGDRAPGSVPSSILLKEKLDKCMEELDAARSEPTPTELEELILAHATLYPEWWEREYSDRVWGGMDYRYPPLSLVVSVVTNPYSNGRLVMRIEGLGVDIVSEKTLYEALRKIDGCLAEADLDRREDAVAEVVAKLREGA